MLVCPQIHTLKSSPLKMVALRGGASEHEWAQRLLTGLRGGELLRSLHSAKALAVNPEKGCYQKVTVPGLELSLQPPELRFVAYQPPAGGVLLQPLS